MALSFSRALRPIPRYLTFLPMQNQMDIQVSGLEHSNFVLGFRRFLESEDPQKLNFQDLTPIPAKCVSSMWSLK
jgi:hypothetical protein